jgi:hypothetical protein
VSQNPRLTPLTPREELAFLKEIHGGDFARIFHDLREAFGLLQARSQMLLGLATICLTITGFSGPRMAASNPVSRFFIGFGLFWVLLSIVAIVVGPLRLRWMTAWRAGSMEDTLVAHLVRRGVKTRLYRAATVMLLTGLSGYLLSLLFYLATVE